MHHWEYLVFLLLTLDHIVLNHGLSPTWHMAMILSLGECESPGKAKWFCNPKWGIGSKLQPCFMSVTWIKSRVGVQLLGTTEESWWENQIVSEVLYCFRDFTEQHYASLCRRLTQMDSHLFSYWWQIQSRWSPVYLFLQVSALYI